MLNNCFRRHATFNIEDFRSEYWGIFRECIIDNVSSEDDRETQIAWRQLILMLIFHMKYVLVQALFRTIRLGYDRELLKMTRSTNRCITPTPNSDINSDYNVYLEP